VTIITGDAYDAPDLLARGYVDAIVTSPPYWGLRNYGFEPNAKLLDEWQAATEDAVRQPGYPWFRQHGGILGLEPYPEWYIAHLVEFLRRLKPSLRPDASVWVNLGDTYFARWSSIRSNGRQGLANSDRQRRRTPTGGWRHDKQLLLIPARFAIAMQEAGWILRNDVIWSKQNLAPRPEQDRLRLSHEHFFHFVQRTPGARPQYYYDIEHAEDGALDVVTASRGSSFEGHSATFPRELVAPRILTSTRPGGVVLDPFCGSGTTLGVAAEHGRIAVGFELSEQFASAAAERLRSELGAAIETRPAEMGSFKTWALPTPSELPRAIRSQIH
jgi:DNA modification methylase